MSIETTAILAEPGEPVARVVEAAIAYCRRTMTSCHMIHNGRAIYVTTDMTFEEVGRKWFEMEK